MFLSDLTDPEAVIAAIKEFDQLGREAFLEKYSFGKAQAYFLIYEGSRYDSKAIAGVAHGKQHPDSGPLQPRDFSGGADTVAKKLTELGFVVTRPRPTKYWAFCANPTRYRIQDAVKHLVFDRWSIGRSDVKAGDKAIIWQTRNSHGLRGIVALADILTDPKILPDDNNPYWINPGDGSDPAPRVDVRYIVPDSFPLWIEDTHIGDFLRSLSVARARGGTVFRLTEEQWFELYQLAKISLENTDEVEAEQILRGRHKQDGQGFGLNAQERRVVELHAMNLARRHFELDWEVIDVSSNSSFDLFCKRGSEELRIEVKGTTTAGDSIILTRNEVKEAAEPGYVLFVVSEIELDSTTAAEPIASGGRCRKIYPVQLDNHELMPLSFACQLDWTAGSEVTRC